MRKAWLTKLLLAGRASGRASGRAVVRGTAFLHTYQFTISFSRKSWTWLQNGLFDAFINFVVVLLDLLEPF